MVRECILTSYFKHVAYYIRQILKSQYPCCFSCYIYIWLIILNQFDHMLFTSRLPDLRTKFDVCSIALFFLNKRSFGDIRMSTPDVLGVVKIRSRLTAALILKGNNHSSKEMAAEFGKSKGTMIVVLILVWNLRRSCRIRYHPCSHFRKLSELCSIGLTLA